MRNKQSIGGETEMYISLLTCQKLKESLLIWMKLTLFLIIQQREKF